MPRTIMNRRQLIAGAGGLGLAAAVGRPALAQSGGAQGKSVQYITFGLQFEYQVAMVDGIRRKGEEAGLAINVIDGKGDPNLQVTQMLDAVTTQPDAILLNPVDATLLVAGVKRANEAGIPVFIMENAPPEGAYLGFVDFDNEAGGAMGADALADLIGGSGVVLETRGSVGSAQAQARHKGFNERMAAAHPEVEIRPLNTEWVADNAYKMVLDAFTQDPAIRGVFSHNDEMIRGVVSALRQIGRLVPVGEEGHIVLVGLDGTPLALDRIREGVQDATVEQSPFAMGGAILDQMIAYFEGRDYEPSAQTQPILVTRENVDSDERWGNFGRT